MDEKRPATERKEPILLLRTVRLLLLPAALVATLPACMQWGAQQRTIDAYIVAMQERDYETCFRLMTPELRESLASAAAGAPTGGDPFRATLEALHEQFERERREGELTFSPEGVALIRALGLGKGAFYQAEFSDSVARAGRAELTLQVILPYNLLDRPDQARTGDVFWRLGRPFGRVYPIIHGMPYLGEMEELLRIRIRAELAACADAEIPSPTGWCVHSLEPLPDTAEFQTVRYSTGLS